MVFRANESILENRMSAERYLLSNLKDLPKDQQEQSKSYLKNIMDSMGHVIDVYPVWHPLIVDKSNWIYYQTPHRQNGYSKIDHNVFFTDGFITCPYNEASNYGQDVIDAVNSLSVPKGVVITAEKIPVTLYNSGTTAILVKCLWQGLCTNSDGNIEMSAITPMLLSSALKIYENEQKSLTIDEMMADYLLGKPCGKRSSLFVGQNEGLQIKKIWQSILNTGMI